MVKIEIGSIVFNNVPDRLEDLTQAQFLACLPFLFAEVVEVQTRVNVAAEILPKQLLKLMDSMDPDEIMAIVEKVTGWMDKTHSACPISFFRIGLTWYHTPIYNRLSIIEAAKAQQYLELYRSTNKEENLNLFIATLCRPKRIWIRFAPWLKWVMPKWDGDIRIRYNAVLVAEEAKAMAKLPEPIKWAIIWHFCQMMVILRKNYKAVFDFRSEEGTGKPSSLMDMIFHLSGSELGDSKSVSHTPITTVMYALHCRLPI